MPRVLLALAAVGALLDGSARAAPLAAYGELPSIEQIAISPDGRLLAIDVTKGEQRVIVVQDIAAGKVVAGIKAGQVKVRHLQWAGDKHLIVTSSVTSSIMGVLADRGEWFVAADLNLATNKLTPLLGDIDYAGNMLGGYPVIRSVGGKPVVYTTGVRFQIDNSESTLVRVDLDTDRSTIVGETTGSLANDFLVAADGRPAALVQYDAPSKQWDLKVWQGNAWRQAEAKTASIETPELRGLGRDGRSILVSDFEDGRYKLRELSPDGARLSDPLPGPGAGEIIDDPVSHAAIGTASLIGDERRYDFFDPNAQLEWRAVEAAFPGRTVALTSWSDDRKTIVVRIESPTDGPGYALVDLHAGSTRWLGPEYLGLTPDDISTVQPIRFKAADGLELTGYLTLPHGRDPKKLPLVVFPHGGPAVRDEPGFDWWAQAMASRGYAVLQVNYRGSEGFGWPFLSAGFGEWGRKMQTDLSDGARYLAAQGTVDPARVCIVGASYGGYAALAGATLDTGVYRCAVDVSGPADLSKLITWGSSREGRQGLQVERYWTRFMGAQGVGDPHLKAISPADHADKVTIPILIIHGKDDTVVPFEQSQIMADALKKAGKPYDFVVLNHEDHWL